MPDYIRSNDVWKKVRNYTFWHKVCNTNLTHCLNSNVYFGLPMIFLHQVFIPMYVEWLQGRSFRDRSLFIAGGGGRRKKWAKCREWATKKLRSPEWASKCFFPKNFDTGGASCIARYCPFILFWNQHTLQICPYRIMSIEFSKNRCRKIIAQCLVGREMFCPRTKLASKNFPVKCHFPPGPPRS